VHLQIDGPVATITLDAPATHNALTPRMLCLLADAVIRFAADDSLRVAIITGAGERAFCSGGDLALTLPLMSGARAPQDDWDSRLLSDPQVLAASGLREFPLDKPVIAAVNGVCMAAGFELMLGTDIRLCAEHARFGLPEVKHALIPFAGSMVRLPRQVQWPLAMELMLTGDPIDARRAIQLGLVNRLVPTAELMPAARALAHHIARNGPLAVRAVKRTALASSGRPLADAYRLEDEAKRLVMASEDAREGPRAFIEKRAAVYTAR
jgi:enoyl-CoA hydratase